MPTKRIVALLTDFGTQDHYVGVMKGVILRHAHSVTFVDITHGVEPHDIQSAAYMLWASYRHFPQDTVFLAIVDPGVGTERRIVCVRDAGYTFLAPDNGLLKFVLGEMRRPKVYAVMSDNRLLRAASPTFHGRDVFAPLCARLAAGASPSTLGREVRAQTRPEHFVVVAKAGPRPIAGSIIHVDRFGNLVTNFSLRTGPAVRLSLSRPPAKRKSFKPIESFARTYADGSHRSPFMLIGSSGLLEVSMRNASAQKALGLETGSLVHLHVRRG